MGKGTPFVKQTPELVEAILTLVRAGKSYNEIATACSTSRSVVAGTVYRAKQRGEDLTGMNPRGGLTMQKTRPPAPERKQAPKRRSCPVAAMPSLKPAAQAAPPEPAVRVLPKPAPIVAVAEAMPAARGAPAAVDALKPSHCRFPLGEPAAEDFRFCCARVPDGSRSIITSLYCSEHRTSRHATAETAGGSLEGGRPWLIAARSNGRTGPGIRSGPAI